MSIEGTYGFVYAGTNGLGVGVFRIEGTKFEGIDYVGGRYRGTASENEDGTVAVAIEFDVLPGAMLVQGTAPQDIPHRRRIVQDLPQGFDDGRPIELRSPPGSVTVMIQRIPDEFARAISEGVRIAIGNSWLT